MNKLYVLMKGSFLFILVGCLVFIGSMFAQEGRLLDDNPWMGDGDQFDYSATWDASRQDPIIVTDLTKEAQNYKFYYVAQSKYKIVKKVGEQEDTLVEFKGDSPSLRLVDVGNLPDGSLFALFFHPTGLEVRRFVEQDGEFVDKMMAIFLPPTSWMHGDKALKLESILVNFNNGSFSLSFETGPDRLYTFVVDGESMNENGVAFEYAHVFWY